MLSYLKTSLFVSKLIMDIRNPFLHNTGGAIDLTLSKNGKEINMGTNFDYFGEKAWTNYFEINENNEDIKNNRRILYNLMIEEGFVNLPSEWWHYDYGDKVWSYFTKNKIMYCGINPLI